MSNAREMTPELMAEVRERADRWGAVPFAAAGSLGDCIRKVNRAHEWPGDDDRDENRDAVDRAADDPDEEVVGMLVDAVRLASRDRTDLLAHVDALTARLEAAEREVKDWRGTSYMWHDDHDKLKARAEAAEAKLAALNAWAGEVLATLDDAAVVDVYGYPESGDPRLFTPDPGSCTPEEMAAHAAALAAVEAGAEPPTWTQDGDRVVHMHRSPWGVGTYRWTDEDAASRRDRLDAALRAARGEP